MAAYVHNAPIAVKSNCTYVPVHFASMTFDDRPDPAKRLEASRLKAGYASAREAAIRFGWKYETYVQHERGERGLSRSASRYAKAFKVSEGWLITGETLSNGDDGTLEIPLLARISAGSFRSHDAVRPEDIERHIKVSHLPRGDWFALAVEGDSMNRIAPDGSIIIVNRADDTLVDAGYYVFSLGNGDATFKKYRREPEPMLTPFSWSPEHYSVPIRDSDLYVFGRVKRVISDL